MGKAQVARRMGMGVGKHCWVAGCLLMLSLLAAAQQPPSQSQQSTPADSAKKPDRKGATSSQQPANDAPAAPKPDAAAENPFPEDVSAGAAAKAKQGDTDASSPDASPPETSPTGTSGSSSSAAGAGSSSSSSTGAGTDPDAAPDVPAAGSRKRLKKPSDKDIQTGSLAGEGRAQEDVRVGSYYLSDRNYQGAYLRFSEAARLDPANIEAIYGLAAAADGLHKKDEAVANYRLYVQVAPRGDRVKAAEKALKSLSR